VSSIFRACGNLANVFVEPPNPDLFTSICHREGCSLGCAPSPVYLQSCPNGMQGAPGSDGIMGICDDLCVTNPCGCPDTPTTEAPPDPNDGYYPPFTSTCVGPFCGGVNPGLGGGFGGTAPFQSILKRLGGVWKALISKLVNRGSKQDQREL